MITIAWDVDDVLNDLMRRWFEATWKKTHPECKIDYEDLSENPPHRILKVSKEEYLESLDAFRADPSYNQMIPVLPVKEWFINHGRQFRHIALTSVPFAAAGVSANWILTHFGRWIRTYHFIPSYRATCQVPIYDRSKKDYLEWIQYVDYLIDDNEDNIKEAESIGIKGILFPRPWNTQKNKPVETALTFLSSSQKHTNKKHDETIRLRI
jgi:5'(3')-deoxyribonucleotidase